MTGRGLPALIVLLTLLAGGPLVAGLLPPGPASLLSPPSVAVAAAALLVLYALFAWPVLIRDRDPRSVATEGLVLLLVGLPFVGGLGWSQGVKPDTLLAAGAVIAGCVVLTGVWLAGPGREGRGDRGFAAFWVLAVAVAPLANYALMDFTRASSTVGFRISPVLTVRRILLELPGAGIVPFLLTGLALLALGAAWRLTRRGATAAALVLACTGFASAAEVIPVFGPHYVPGRPLVLRLEGQGEVEVVVPGRGTCRAAAEGGFAFVFIPGIEGLREVTVGGRVVPLQLRPVAPGAWVVSLGPVTDAHHRAAAEFGYTIARAAPGAENLHWPAYFPLDGLVDGEGRLPERYPEWLGHAGVPVMPEPAGLPTAPPLRRPWEEAGRIGSAEGFERMFGPGPGADPARARTVFVVLLLFALTALAIHRHAAGRRSLTPLLLLLAVLATAVPLWVVPAVADFTVESVTVSDAGVSNSVYRVRCLRTTTARIQCTAFPVLLGRGAPVTIRAGSWGADLQIPMKKGQTRFFAVRDKGGYTGRIWDFFLTPDGLAKPGETALPAGEFLERHFTGPDGRTTATGWLVRKLLRLDGSIGEKYGVRIADPRRLEVGRVAD